jgi:hypothetical protein
MSKRVSGTPRHPRSPVAKAVRTPAFKMQVVPDKRWQSKLKDSEPEVKVDDSDKSKD